VSAGGVVVLLHGQPGSALDWRLVAAALPPDLAVVASDRPGYGSNPAPATGLSGNAHAVLDLLDRRGIESATVVGHSWGGGVAVALAEQHPERVDGLVLAASIGPHCLVAVDRLLAARIVGPPIVRASFVLGGPLGRRRFRRVIGRDAEVAEMLAANRARGLWRTFVIEQRAMISELPALDAGLGAIRAPTTVVTGGRDRLIPRVTPRALAAAIPGARLEVLERAGHTLPMRAPVALARAIAETIARARAG
jgi:pimeloyl-ACP methyl ester carboxylesterase